MLSIFSCASWPSVCLLWRNVYLGLLPIFGLGCLFFCYWKNRKSGRKEKPIARKKNTNLGHKIINKEISSAYPASNLSSTFLLLHSHSILAYYIIYLLTSNYVIISISFFVQQTLNENYCQTRHIIQHKLQTKQLYVLILSLQHLRFFVKKKVIII